MLSSYHHDNLEFKKAYSGFFSGLHPELQNRHVPNHKFPSCVCYFKKSE